MNVGWCQDNNNDDEGREKIKQKRMITLCAVSQGMWEWEGSLIGSIGDCQTRDQPWGMFRRKSLTETRVVRMLRGGRKRASEA